MKKTYKLVLLKNASDKKINKDREAEKKTSEIPFPSRSQVYFISVAVLTDQYFVCLWLWTMAVPAQPVFV